MAGINRLIAWWESLAFPWRAWRVIGQVAAGDEVPDRLPAKGVFLVGTLEAWPETLILPKPSFS